MSSTFPMALDEADHRLFVGTHQPARMAVFDTTSGRMAAALPGVQGTDDLYYDGDPKRIYMPGSEGSDSGRRRDCRLFRQAGQKIRSLLPASASLTLRVDRPKMAVLYIGSSVYKLFTPYPCVLLRLKPWFGCSLGVWNEK
jgi:hypothetical protein